MSFLSILVSVISFYLIQNNLRRTNSPHVIAVVVGFLILLLAFALCVYKFPATFSTTFANQQAVRYRVNWSKPPRQARLFDRKIRVAIADRYNYTGFDRISDAEDPTRDGLRVLNRSTNTSTPIVLALGDSHMNMVIPRFQRLWEFATNYSHPFPTVYLRGRNDEPPLACSPNHTLDVALIKQLKPKIVFYNADWNQFLRGRGSGPKGATPICCAANDSGACANQSRDDVVDLLTRFEAELKELRALGIQVFVNTINPFNSAYSPSAMLRRGVHEPLPAPVSRLAFRKKYKDTIGLLEKAMANANATLIDLSDNMCYNDLCQVVSMREGEPVMWDTHHIRPFFARNYLTSIDAVVAAALDCPEPFLCRGGCGPCVLE
ncbi:Aste57867_16660 [Aphanomyces stellatus]|nr:hypothetical protein As57867_016603 [Aphanomyces stellatus]KAF0705091.1 hypothetical protein As57867_007115 [Aphanomyces stellatus]VFT84071.1 Aste57867_7139 [Aphanomyces stellatus]VFT93431.1 Aste57867_16660 [Aphanomyces stellatus]